MKQSFRKRIIEYKKDPLSLVLYILVLLAIVITISSLLFIVIHIVSNGIGHLKPSLFEFEYSSENVSMLPFIFNTVYLIGLSLLVALPLGIGCAIYLVEYASRGNRLVKYVRITTETLSGIPSIIFGLFGLIFFNTTLGLGYSLLSGSLTVAIMILPLIIRSTEEALKSVPDSYREASFGIGAATLRTVFKVVLPSAIPGILSGVILSIGRIIGETAALIFTLGMATKVITDVGSSGRTLAIHMYMLAGENLHVDESYATAVVLLVLVFALNTIASFVAKKLQNKKY